MNLTSTRVMLRSDGIFSKVIRDDNGEQVFVVCEHSYLQPDGVAYLPILQPGVYDCVRGMHNLHGPIVNGKPTLIPFETFEVLGVVDSQGKAHSGILFVHFGNWETDSDGCSVCGSGFAVGADPADGMKLEEMVVNSRSTFTLFKGLQQGVDKFQLTVV